MASVTEGKAGVKDASDQNFDYMFKLLIIGNSSVGKTSFLFRYADDTFTPAFVSTVGIDFKVKTVYRHEKRVKLQIWVSARHCGQNGTGLWAHGLGGGASLHLGLSIRQQCHFRSGPPLPHFLPLHTYSPFSCCLTSKRLYSGFSRPRNWALELQTGFQFYFYHVQAMGT